MSTPPLVIRKAQAEDADRISALIRGVAHHFMVRPDDAGAERFLETIGPAGIARTIADPRMNYLAGFVGTDLAGVVAVRDNAHLFHLFVSPKFQRKGIAAELWRTAREEAVASGNSTGFTVNSTPYAKAVYERFGFRETGPLVQKDGIEFIPMRLVATSSSC